MLQFVYILARLPFVNKSERALFGPAAAFCKKAGAQSVCCVCLQKKKDFVIKMRSEQIKNHNKYRNPHQQSFKSDIYTEWKRRKRKLYFGCLLYLYYGKQKKNFHFVNKQLLFFFVGHEFVKLRKK